MAGGQVTLIVDGLGELGEGGIVPGEPGRVEGGGSEEVAKYFSQNGCQSKPLLFLNAAENHMPFFLNCISKVSGSRLTSDYTLCHSNGIYRGTGFASVVGHQIPLIGADCSVQLIKGVLSSYNRLLADQAIRERFG